MSRPLIRKYFPIYTMHYLQIGPIDLYSYYHNSYKYRTSMKKADLIVEVQLTGISLYVQQDLVVWKNIIFFIYY